MKRRPQKNYGPNKWKIDEAVRLMRENYTDTEEIPVVDETKELPKAKDKK